MKLDIFIHDLSGYSETMIRICRSIKKAARRSESSANKCYEEHKALSDLKDVRRSNMWRSLCAERSTCI